jgi:hypothetical protein
VGPQEQVDYRWQAVASPEDACSCLRERETPMGGLSYGHVETGHMDLVLADRG